jgi:imidazolonepropionase-like amidohydrolase
LIPIKAVNRLGKLGNHCTSGMIGDRPRQRTETKNRPEPTEVSHLMSATHQQLSIVRMFDACHGHLACAAITELARRQCPTARHSVFAAALGGLAFIVTLLSVTPLPAQLLERPVALQNARILTLDGRVIDRGTLLIKGERIVALGTKVDVPLLAKRIDARGGTITPGLIDAFCTLAMTAPTGGSANPTRRAEDGFDRYDTAMLIDAIRNGVTAAYIPAGRPAGICGTGAVLRLLPGAGSEDSYGSVLKSQAALCINLDSANKPVSRLKTFTAVQKQFRDALEHRRKLEEYEEKLAEYKEEIEKETKEKEEAKPKAKPKPTAAEDDEEKKPEDKAEEKKKEDDAKPKKPPRPARNPKAELILRAIDREIPVRVLASGSADILNALELAEAYSLDLILEDATEAHLVADRIADADVPIVLGRLDKAGLRRNDLYRRAAADLPAALSEAGVSWTVGSGTDGGARSRFVLFNAQLAAAHDRGNDPLTSVTANAADFLRVADKIGRLRPGLLADFVLWSGHPLDPTSSVRRVYVGGTLAYEATDQSEKGSDN